MFKLFKKLFKRNEVNYFDCVPDEIVKFIFSFLKHKELLKTSRVNQRFQQIASEKDLSLTAYLTSVAQDKLNEQQLDFVRRSNRLRRTKNETLRTLHSQGFVNMNLENKTRYLNKLKKTNLLHNTAFEQAYTILFNTLRSVLDRLGPSVLDPLYEQINDYMATLYILKSERNDNPANYEKQLFFCENLSNFLKDNGVTYPDDRKVTAVSHPG